MKVWQKISVFLAMLVLCFGMINMPVSAATNTQDGLKVTLTTDKDTYSQSDEIKVNISVENTNSFDVNNVSLESVIPDGLELKKDYSSSATIGTLAAGDSYSCALVLQQREESVPVEDDENADSEDSGEGTSTTENQSSQTSTSTDKNSTNQNEKANESDSVQTGDFTLVIPTTIVLVLSAAVIIFLLHKKKNRIFMFFLGIAGSALLFNNGVIDSKAAETVNQGSISLNEIIQVGDNKYELQVNVNYEWVNNQDNGDNEKIELTNLSTDETYFVVDDEFTITFTVDVNGNVDSTNLYSGDNNFVGVMHDDGINGDDIANDGTYTYELTTNEDIAGAYEYYAKAGDSISEITTIYFFARPTESLQQEFIEVQQNLGIIASKYEDESEYVPENLKQKVMDEVHTYLAELMSNETILLYEIEDNSAYIKFLSGLTLMFEIPAKDVSGDGTDVELDYITYQPHPDIYQESLSSYVDEVADYFYSESSHSESEEVTLDQVKSIGSNQVVLWNGHGGYGPIVKSYLASGEEFDWSAWFWDTTGYYWDCVRDLIICRGTEEQSNLACFTSKFIDNYCGDLSNDLIILMSCHSGQDEKLANAFLNKGATAVVGFTDEVYTAYAILIGANLLDYMSTENQDSSNYFTLAEALDSVKIDYGNNDIEYARNNPETFKEIKSTIAEPIIFGGREAENYRLDTFTSKPEEIPSDSLEFNGHKYKFYDNSMTWEEAKAFCEEQGGHLVTITSADEQNAIYQYAKQFDVHSDIWIGISDAEVEGDWSHWITGEEVTFTNWGTGEPDNYQGIEQDYGVMCMEHKSGSGYEVQPGQWDDIAANGETASGYFICEWDNNETVFEAGDGSEENPYQVSNAEQLDAVRNDLTAHYIQVADIDMSGYEWSPIGTGYGGGSVLPPFGSPSTENIPFEGEYNGNNYKITNLSITENEHDTVGLFGLCSENSKIENITIENLSITVDKSSTDYVEQWENGAVNAVSVGGIAGRCESIISNCKVSGNIEVINCNSAYVGGITGNGGVLDSVNYADIYVLSNRDSRYTNDGDVQCGGITGYPGAVFGAVERCTNYGNIDAISGNFMYCGGISGEYGAIKKCVNYGDVNGSTSDYHSYSSFAGNCNVGGIVGATSGQISDSVNYGSINGDAALGASCYAGGVAGYNGYYGNGIIENCFNVGDTITATKLIEQDEVIVSVAGEAGRIAGRSQSTTNCYSVDSTLVNGGIPATNIGTDNLNGASLSKEDIESMVNQLLSSN